GSLVDARDRPEKGDQQDCLEIKVSKVSQDFQDYPDQDSREEKVLSVPQDQEYQDHQVILK
ncbi:hypothetical protein scyTo_0027177, partial [Scyliorhinus torazame]|nr:hypothetical protein [Scyliorhinus torazame]